MYKLFELLMEPSWQWHLGNSSSLCDNMLLICSGLALGIPSAREDVSTIIKSAAALKIVKLQPVVQSYNLAIFAFSYEHMLESAISKEG